MRQSLGLQAGKPNLGREKSQAWKKPVSDAQYLTLKDFKAKLPADAVVSLHNGWDTTQDEDGDTVTDDATDILYAQAAWKEGQVKVIARCALGPIPVIETLD